MPVRHRTPVRRGVARDPRRPVALGVGDLDHLETGGDRGEEGAPYGEERVVPAAAVLARRQRVGRPAQRRDRLAGQLRGGAAAEAHDVEATGHRSSISPSTSR
ncbi:hypothetical protein [Nocardioides zeae]